MRVICDHVESGHLEFECVIEADFADVLREDSERADPWSAVVDRVWVYDDQVPINMHLVDDTALIWLCGADEAGEDVVPKGLLESENPRVVSWAESFYEEYLDAARRLTPDLIAT
jgi:hypothetical protein